ncbi:GntR family transcriptional regulator [Actinosynnema sp. NPDC020468]|uniref:TetR/AcrR family transcriptional regulator C-terminal domain-containing protein n=1 Tax=Actinosynnema sp. NPDC020468 TaxID=3154488 RepID=UPI0033E2E261
MTQPAPFQRIAAELRRRVVEGELAPGDRVPSTRAIVKEWGVAMATATKVLAVLRDEGLTHVEPGVGTVVAHQARRKPTGDRELTRDRVVAAAVAIADAEGLAALSMRTVAARLGVATMSPYRYVGGKDELIALMADAAFGEVPFPPEPEHWRTALEVGARALWTVHRAHPWLAQLGPITRPLVMPNLLAYSEWMLRALSGHGFDAATMLNLNVLLYGHVQGLAVHLEREANEASASGMSDEQWLDSQEWRLAEFVTPAAHPTFTAVLASLTDSGFDLDLDLLFDLGLTAILNHVESLAR